MISYALHAFPQRRTAFRIDPLLGKVDEGLKVGDASEQVGAKRVDLIAQASLQLTGGGTGGSRGLGADEIHHRLGLGQVELAVEEGPLGELARTGHAGTGLKHRGQHTRGDQRSPMAADLDKILARVAAGVAEDREQHLVDDLAMRINDPAEGDAALLHRGRRLGSAEDRVGHGQCPGAADPDHGQRPLAGRRGDRGDCLPHGYLAAASFPSAASALSS